MDQKVYLGFEAASMHDIASVLEELRHEGKTIELLAMVGFHAPVCEGREATDVFGLLVEVTK